MLQTLRRRGNYSGQRPNFRFPNAGRYGIDERRHMICLRTIKNVGSGIEERHRRFGTMMPPGPG